jgi:hypothetical protein
MDVGAITTGRGVQTGTVRDTTAPPKESAASTASSDSVSISRGGLFRVMSESFLGGAGKDGVITMEELQSFREAKLQEADTILTKTLASLDISRDTSFDISLASDNSVTVSGNLGVADRDKLQNALSADADFVQSYNAASGVSSVIAAAEASENFTEMYAENAKEAVARYSWLFGKTWDQELTFRNGVTGMRSA